MAKCRYCRDEGCVSCGKHPDWCGEALSFEDWLHCARVETFGSRPWNEPGKIVWAELRGPFLPLRETAICWMEPCPQGG